MLTMTCPIEGCTKEVSTAGLCGMHYRRVQVHGNPHTVLRPVFRGTPEERLREWSQPRESGCIEYTGKLRRDGYAGFKLGEKSHLAHRVAYELAKGPIPEGAEIRHTCDNRACINPDHLVPGTRQDNVDDCTRQLRHIWGERSPHSKLTAEQVYEIRDSAEPRKELAARFGVRVQTVRGIQIRKKWKNLPERVLQ